GAARTGDQDLEAARLGAAGVLEQQVGRAVGGDDAYLVRHPELLERVGGMAQRLPVGAGAHDDADERLHQPSITMPPATGITCPAPIWESWDASHTAVPVRSSGSSAR